MKPMITSTAGIKKALYRSLGIVVVLSIIGCAHGPQPTAKLEDVIAQESGSKHEIKEMNEKLFASVSRTPTMKDYVLGEGDLVQVTVFEAQELKTEGRVGARGFVTLPLLGPVDVKELTASEAERKIEELYRRKYIHNPHVSLFVKEQVSGKITIMGAARKPGSFPYLARQTLLESLAMAEGFTDTAGRTVQVRRAGEDPLHPSTFLVDLDDLIKRGQGELNIEIKSGDIIYIPDAGTVYVDGAVRKPGNYSVKQEMSVHESIVAAGGFSSVADEGNIKLVRHVEDGRRDVIQFSAKDIKDGSVRDMKVKDRDVIFVESNRIEKLIYGLQLNFGGGLFGFGYKPPVD